MSRLRRFSPSCWTEAEQDTSQLTDMEVFGRSRGKLGPTSRLLQIFCCIFTDLSFSFSACFFCSSLLACSCSNWTWTGSRSSSQSRNAASSLRILVLSLMFLRRCSTSSSCRCCSTSRMASTLARAALVPRRRLSSGTTAFFFWARKARHSLSTYGQLGAS